MTQRQRDMETQTIKEREKEPKITHNEPGYAIRIASSIIIALAIGLGFIWAMSRIDVEVKQKTMQSCIQKLGEEVYRCKNLPIIWE